MSDARNKTGQQGEEIAASYLEQEGLNIVQRNYRCPLGEMDIIAQDGNSLIFVEVRTRSTGRYGWGEESITAKKRERLNRIVSFYLVSQQVKAWPPLRFDLIAIRANKGGQQPEITWLKGI